MLTKPDVNVETILELADFMEALPPEKYNQTKCFGNSCCIWGWDMVRNHQSYHDSPDHGVLFCERMGINRNQFCKLVDGRPFSYYEPTSKDAARVLRHLAYTGEVNWNILR
jgi:hypothetical protein